jgi:CO dehydrogenase maturation factor
MKLAISGKGGVGKTTISAILALLMARRGWKVLALDADPVSNLAAALGFSPEQRKQIIPVSQHKALIEERTGARVNEYGQMFKINPEVSDIADKFAITSRGVSLLVMGAVRKGGGGCACPENVLIRALVADLVLHRGEALVMDMEAGIEHLGRATAGGVDALIVVAEPGRMAVDCARRIISMAREIGLKRCFLIGNKIVDTDDEEFLRSAFPGNSFLEMIPHSGEIRNGERKDKPLLERLDPGLMERFDKILDNLDELLGERG